MQKAKDFDIAGSNVELFGSPLETEIKKAAAKCDPAWQNVGQKPGVEVFRIEKFAVKAYKDLGKFFSGDSYIVLHTYKKEDKLAWNVYFWLGAETTQDEAGTAAYKTVELDTLLDDAPVQYREVEGHESKEFLELWKKQGGIRILDGGVESGFRHVKPEEYKPRLLWIKGQKNIRIMQVEMSSASLDSNDVFILDNGLTLYQWNGSGAGAMEKARGAQLARAIDDERKGQPKVIVLEDGEEDETAPEWTAFWELLGGKGEISNEKQGDADWEKVGQKKLFRLSDADGELSFELVKEGKITKDDLSSDDVNIFDVNAEVIIYIGKNANENERKNAMTRATEYLKAQDRPLWTPISRVLEGGENEVFKSFLN